MTFNKITKKVLYLGKDKQSKGKLWIMMKQKWTIKIERICINQY